MPIKPPPLQWVCNVPGKSRANSSLEAAIHPTAKNNGPQAQQQRQNLATQMDTIRTIVSAGLDRHLV